MTEEIKKNDSELSDAIKSIKHGQEKWKEKNLCFQFIPAYSPELNGIEVFRHHIKNVWLKIEDFQSY